MGAKTLSWLILFAQLLLAGRLMAEPLNFMIGDITFTRPKNWRWEAPSESSTAAARFFVYNGEAKTSTQVVGYYVSADVTSIVTNWQAFFDSKEQSNVETVKIGEHEITYISAAGAFYKKKKLPNQRLFGVVIPREKQKRNVTLRVYGPKNEVDRVIDEFKKTVEAALKENP